MFDDPPILLAFFVAGFVTGITFRDTADEIIVVFLRWLRE